MAKQNKTSKNKKGNSSNTPKVISNNYKGKLSIVIPLYNEIDRVELMHNALSRFEKRWHSPYEVILVNDGSSDETLEYLKENYPETAEENTVEYKIINLEQNKGKGNALKEGVLAATGDHILTLDADMAASPSDLLHWLNILEGKTFDDNQILIASREHKKSEITQDGSKRKVLGNFFNYWVQLLTGLNQQDTQCGFKLYPKKIAHWLFGSMATKGWAHDVELLHKAHLHDVEIIEMPIKWKEVEQSKIDVWSDGIKMGFTSFGISVANNFKFFFTDPIKEMKNPTPLDLEGKKDAPIYRFLFAVLALLLFLIMPSLSFDYGITADEIVQMEYGNHVLEYFESGKIDDKALTYKNLYLYGGFFDYITAWWHKNVFSSWDIYEMRHMFNALVGALLMLFTGLLARTISGKWSVAFWALLFIALSPRIFGHSMNNPKDIPFAAGYLISLFFMFNFVRKLPRPSVKSIIGLIVGIAITLNIRIGGLLLIPYLFLFTGAALILEKSNRSALLQNLNINSFELGKVLLFGLISIVGIAIRRDIPIQTVLIIILTANSIAYFFSKSVYLRLFLALCLITFLGYMGGSLYWPYAQEDIINGPLMALSEMSNFSTGIRMIWEGQHKWSEFLPWYYIPKWMGIATPLVILLGLPLVLFALLKDNKNRWFVLMAIFTGVFPIAYTIYQDSPLYDAMRHFLFVYPILVIISAYSFMFLLDNFHNKTVKLVGSVMLVLALYSPIRWMIVSHPNQYTYFNELTGGIDNVLGYYETDYWMNSTKEACNWAIENIPEIKKGEEVRFGTQAHRSVQHYFKDYPNVIAVYTRYHERAKHDWDYGLYVSRFANKKCLEQDVLPAGNELIHKVEVDGIALCTISKRSEINKKSAEAAKAFKAKKLPEAISLLEEVVKENPKDESSWMLLTQYRLQAGQIPKAKEAAEKLNTLVDNYSNAAGMLGLCYLQAQDIPNAKKEFERSVQANKKYTFGNFHLARLLATEQKYDEAITCLEAFDKYGGNPANGYDLAIQICTQQKNTAKKAYFTAKKLSRAGKWPEALQQLAITFSILPDYAPAVKMQKDYDSAVTRQRSLAERKERLKGPIKAREERLKREAEKAKK